MAKVGVLVDTETYALPPQVDAHYQGVISAGIASGAQTAIQGMPGIAQAVSDALVPLTTTAALAAAGVTLTNQKNVITGYYHCEGYGAGPGKTGAQNVTAIQAAINAANTDYNNTGVPQKVWVGPGTFPLGVVDYHPAGGGTSGIVSLMLKDGVTIDGVGTLKVAAGGYGAGAAYRVIGSINTGISRAGIRNITIDGNRAAFEANVSASNIVVVGLADIAVENVKSVNANGVAIMVRSPSQDYAMTRVRIKNNVIQNASDIGIQCSGVNGLQIQGNIVSGCGNNGIDVYNENGTGTPTGGNIDVSGNEIDSCAVGIFMETSRFFTVAHNNIALCAQSAIWVNRINGAPQGIVSLNQINGTPVGVQVLGATFGVLIHGNMIFGVSIAGIRLGWGGDCSNVDVRDNWIEAADGNTHPLVLTDGATASHIRVKGTRTTGTNPTWFYVNTATSRVDVTVESPAANA